VIDKINFIGVFLPITPIKFNSWRSQIASSEVVSSAPFSLHIHDQMNNCWDLSTVAKYLKKALPYNIIEDGNILNYVTKVMKLTWGKLLQQDDWLDWQDSENLQLNQYNAQGMFGDPVASKEDDAIFHLVWTYAIKAVNGRKKT
jgi:hypothetical protein